MANLIAKKLSKQPIGTHVELTYGDGAAHHELVRGMITDNDFEANVEITTSTGEEIVLDYAIVRGVQVTKSLVTVLTELSSGTRVRFSYGGEENREPDRTGVVTENDNEENVEIRLSSGEEIVLHYSLIRSLIVEDPAVPTPAPAPQPVPVPAPQPAPQPVATPAPQSVQAPPVAVLRAPPPQLKAAVPATAYLSQQTPQDMTNMGDSTIRMTFDRLQKQDRQKLNSVFERYKYGVKISDKNKLQEAANQARQILFQEDDNGYIWSRNAALFCGYLLRRVNVYDPEVFLVGECFEEAAYAAWKKGEYILSGAYAITALLENTELTRDMVILLSHSVIEGNDCSGLRFLNERMPRELEPQLKEIILDAFQAKGFPMNDWQNIDHGLQLLESLYPSDEMADEAESWLPVEEEAEPEEQPVEEEKPEEPAAPPAPVYAFGTITRLNWSEHTGIITSDDGDTYTFRYSDIANDSLAKAIEKCLRSDLDGKVYIVRFAVDKKNARNISLDDTMVDRARAIAADASREDRYDVAFALYKAAMETSDTRRALGDMVKVACSTFNARQQTVQLKEAVALYEKNVTYYPSNAFAVMQLAQAYAYLKKYPPMFEHAEKALAFPGLLVRQKIALVSQYLTMLREYYDISGDKALLGKMLEKSDELKKDYSSDFESDPQVQGLYAHHILHHRVTAQCGLDLLEAAEIDYAQVPEIAGTKAALEELMEKTRKRLTPKVEEPVVPEVPLVDLSTCGYLSVDDYDDPPEEEIQEEEILPYQDTDGFEALKLTKQDVVDYALHIDGPDRIPGILAYLRAGASLKKEIQPVYRAVALAANDPMEAPDYSITALVSALADSDSDYHDLNDYCMAAAFLRASFLSGRGYDYSAQGLRDSISITQRLSALRDAYDTLEAFRKEAGRAIDIYADYRNHGVKQLKVEMDATVRRADELYTRFILTPAREGAKFARILETKKIVFARDGYLATMLRYILENNQDALESEKENFITTYLNGNTQLSAKQINPHAVDNMVVNCWDLAGKNMHVKKANSTLQGDCRNNLRSNISEVLSIICQWYALSEQSAGLTWRTEQGEAAYQRLRPQLLHALEQLVRDCDAELEFSTDRQVATGLFLLAAAARELSARLDGSWKFDQEKYLYVDFLRSNNIMLNADFMPELSSTFCVLPEFNVLARIRNHVENPKLSFQEQIDRIYGPEKTCNNYGTADRIQEYLQVRDEAESITLPENPERFLTYTQMQIDMRFRSFRETYALAINYGQIIKSDAFCYTLEDTVRYWYAFCKESQNYGFFTNILLQAENQIHASAQQYETQLDEQLDALIASNQPYFDEHPDYAEAIRAQIANQNFTVAEDWMARIRIGDFSLDVQQPEALAYLDSFWNNYVVIYNRVADASRSLSALLGRREPRNKDTKRAQQMIDNWLSNGNPSNPERIGALLNLLGWQNIHVNQCRLAAEPRAEIYEVHQQISHTGLVTPQHPIAAFGSALERKRMYVVCLYGIYDCERLYEKMRAMDVLDGSKIFLLDYAMGQADRRALARKLKKRESGLRNVNMVIDRVLITHLANIYNENLINRILMATAMPFTYCQPYVVESVHTMPPEIFIGRKDELLKIEQAEGVNLIYGGRQLGKSALFKKALADLDGYGNQRAVLIDIKELDCAAAAKKLSTKLIDLGITPDGEVTEDWEVLCRNIERRLRSQEDEISYLLLMLDEADAFINDCANCGYRPLVALKDVQQSLPGKFKHVLAGLHNIVKFNRQVALGNNSVITHMPSLKITPFRTPEAQELLTEPLSYLGFSLPSKVTVSQILATCNYFPGLIQLYAKKLIESIRNPDYAGYDIKKTPPYVVSDEHLRRVMADKEFVEQIHEKFEITLTLDQDQGSCYYPLTLLIGWMYNVMPAKGGYTAKDVLHHAKDLSLHSLASLDEGKIDALLLELQDLNILRSVSNNSYLLASKNFRDLLGSDEEIFEKLMAFGGVTV